MLALLRWPCLTQLRKWSMDVSKHPMMQMVGFDSKNVLVCKSKITMSYDFYFIMQLHLNYQGMLDSWLANFRLPASCLHHCCINSRLSVASEKPHLTARSQDISINFSGLDHALWAICLKVPPNPTGQVYKPSLGLNPPMSDKWMVFSVECLKEYMRSTMPNAVFIRFGTASMVIGTPGVSFPATTESSAFGEMLTRCLLRGGMVDTASPGQVASSYAATAKTPLYFAD